MHTKLIAIIGGGFCGMMTAVYLLRSARPVNIVLINEGYPFGRGVAYSAHTEKYLLNVRAINMSAFEEEKYHFVQWLSHHPAYAHIPGNILHNVYAPRKIYGDYLNDVWQKALSEKHSLANISVLPHKAINITEQGGVLSIHLDNNDTITAAYVVLATGNTAPGHIFLQNSQFLQSPKYYANPWKEESVKHVHDLKSILIAGNGLTMVDTVQGLLENGFKGTVYTISPNGYKLIPHKYNLMVYDKIAQELPENISLKELFVLIRAHAKALTKVGIGAQLVIDALRPFTQQLWQNFSLEEKKYFIRKLSHAWAILRHRLPLHIHEMMQLLRLQNRLIPIKGKIKDIIEKNGRVTVAYFDATKKRESILKVGRVINCTGPENDIRHSANELLRNLSAANIIMPDELSLGINADAGTGAIINNKGEKSERIFTTGSNLKGILWENTAVPDIRSHTKKVAAHLTNIINN